jgi:hypothetical protein
MHTGVEIIAQVTGARSEHRLVTRVTGAGGRQGIVRRDTDRSYAGSGLVPSSRNDLDPHLSYYDS